MASDVDGDTTWFWGVVDAAGLADLPSDEIAALRLLCKRAAQSEKLEAEAERLKEENGSLLFSLAESVTELMRHEAHRPSGWTRRK